MPNKPDLAGLIERVERRAAECSVASASDDKDRFMNVVAKLTRADGALMSEAVALLRAMQEERTPEADR